MILRLILSSLLRSWQVPSRMARFTARKCLDLGLRSMKGPLQASTTMFKRSIQPCQRRLWPLPLDHVNLFPQRVHYRLTWLDCSPHCHKLLLRNANFRCRVQPSDKWLHRFMPKLFKFTPPMQTHRLAVSPMLLYTPQEAGQWSIIPWTAVQTL